MNELLQETTALASNEARKGLLITIEGGEGAGKTSTVHELGERLKSEGHKVLITREPGGLPTGEAIRSVLLGHEGMNLETLSQVLLFSAARLEHLEKKVLPALAEGYIVLLDRYYDSTLVYQGIVGGYDFKRIKDITNLVIGGAVPDKTYILDIEVEHAQNRLAQREGEQTWFDKQPKAYHERVRNGFLHLAMLPENAERIEVVDASASLEVVTEDVYRRVQQLL